MSCRRLWTELTSPEPSKAQMVSEAPPRPTFCQGLKGSGQVLIQFGLLGGLVPPFFWHLVALPALPGNVAECSLF